MPKRSRMTRKVHEQQIALATFPTIIKAFQN
jgi:hypothetical protein